MTNEQRNMINEAMDYVDTGDLTNWEDGFITSLHDDIDAEPPLELTPNQIESLDQIWSKIQDM